MIGKISVGLFCFYFFGIFVFVFGEIIILEAIVFLIEVLNLGGIISGLVSEELIYLVVVN